MITPGGRLKAFMKANKITQNKLAAESLISQSSLSRMILNEQPMTFQLLEYLYFKYKINPAYFFDESISLKVGTQKGHSGDINKF